MSAESAWDVQAGVFSRLTGYAPLTSLLSAGAASVLDHVPPGTAFPYVVIGETVTQPIDTQAISGNDVTLTVHTYSRDLGMQQAKLIMAAVYDALHRASFAVPYQTLVLCLYLDGQTMLETDGLTRHAIQRFQIITEPA